MQMISEAKTDASLRAELVLATKTEGDAVRMRGNGWTLRIAMVSLAGPMFQADTLLNCFILRIQVKDSTPPETAVSVDKTLQSLSPLLRLLFLQTYAFRRSPRTVKPPRYLLASISALLDHRRRAETLSQIMDRQLEKAREAGVENVELSGEGDEDDDDDAVLASEVELLLRTGGGSFGGRKTLRIGKT